MRLHTYSKGVSMFFISLIYLFACDTKSNDSSFPSCDEVESPVSADEETLLGFTPQEVANELPISSTTGLEWEDGSTDCLHYSIQLDADTARNVDVEYAELDTNGPIATIAIECNDYVAIDGLLLMSTPDGEINEEQALTMIYTLDEGTGEIFSSFTIITNTLSGTLDLSNVDESAEFLINGGVSNGQFSGSLTMQTSGTDGEIAWAENTYLAQWGNVDAPADCQNDNE
jgi:hypothetical protein